MRQVDNNIMKEVLKNDYDVSYSSYNYTPHTTGYYGSRARILLYLVYPISADNKLIKDIKELKRVIPGHEDRTPEKAFYKVELIHDGRTIAIDV